MPKKSVKKFYFILYLGNNAALELSLWASICVVAQDARHLENMVDRAAALAFQEGFCCEGDQFLVTAGVPLDTPGALSFLRIASQKVFNQNLYADL